MSRLVSCWATPRVGEALLLLRICRTCDVDLVFSSRICSRTPAQPAHRTASLLLTSLFAAVIASGVFETVAPTACCFVIKH
jgi:hypothetical protein